MVLHNLFFVVLAAAIYFSLIPLFETRVADARSRETSLVTEIFAEDRPVLLPPGTEIYGYREGTPAELALSEEARKWLDEHPGAIFQDPFHPDHLLRKNARTGLYRSLVLPAAFYDNLIFRAKLTLLLVLGGVYVLAVLALELIVMPKYVYQPIRLMLAADQATRRGNREEELIDDSSIPGDEIGQIMRSRNATVSDLRKQEDDLAEALARLEDLNEDLKRKNYLLETAKRSIAEQDRLASLGLLSASVAHELNTPLSVLQGSVEKLMETVSNPAAQERLARMRRVTERLRKISEALVDFSRARSQTLEPVPVRPVIEEAWGLMAIDEKASEVRFRNEVDAGASVAGNADSLVQLFVNLLRNSLLAVGSGGNIVVRSRLETGEISWVAVTVEDDGPGIPTDVLPHIFEAFVTTRLDSRGTGLGLTVAEGIVHQHGGTIEASNRPGGGAILEVKLPAAGKEQANPL